MAMRPRGGAAATHRRGPRTAVRAVFEDFRPVSEWKQDDESLILTLYLPGFSKEQIKVSTEGQNTIRVRGERLVGSNKWSRFLENFQVPENGKMNFWVRAKFQGGILSITVPRKQDDKLQETLTPKPEGNDVQNPPTDIKNHDKVLPEVSTNQPADKRSTPQQKTSADPSIKKGQDEAFPAVNSSSGQSAEEKSLESQKAADFNKWAHDQNGDQRNASVTPFRNKEVAPYRDAEKEISESKEKNIASDRPYDLTSDMVNKERKKNDLGTKKLPEDEDAIRRDGVPKRKAEKKELHGNLTKEKYKKAVEGLAELNEERQLLVNMGAAMLVIMALTAYVTYKFASGKDKN